MRATIKTTFALFLLLPIAAVSARPALAQTSTQLQPSTAPEMPSRAELALNYSYLHSNAPPSGCGCFNLNGGSADFAWAIKPGSWALVGDVVSGHAGNLLPPDTVLLSRPSPPACAIYPTSAIRL